VDSQFFLNRRRITQVDERDDIECDALKDYNPIQSDGIQLCSKGHHMKFVKEKAKRPDGFVWRCMKCKTSTTIRDKTIFNNTKLLLYRLMMIISHWASETVAEITSEKQIF
jgi:hypothetical protein